ncbi:hypothetical protein ACIPJS_15725 [Streptomyces sp. NPDC086783]|uniref:hypothetical protein n=1 Tax=Streptomyces sp. NPDC086783 TaxID=3365758 RepID=UPI00382FB640
MRKKSRYLALGLAGLGVAAGCWFSYAQFFTKGLDHLPEKLCDEGVRREAAIRILPDARTAESGSERRGTGDGFMFSCHVYADDDSILSGEVKIQDSNRQTWDEYYESYGGKSPQSPERTASGDVRALARNNYASVYVPCVPSGSDAGDASQTYSLISEVRVIGESRTTGLELHQALTDFAYELTRRAYVLGECQDGQKFPERLPRFHVG